MKDGLDKPLNLSGQVGGEQGSGLLSFASSRLAGRWLVLALLRLKKEAHQVSLRLGIRWDAVVLAEKAKRLEVLLQSGVGCNASQASLYFTSSVTYNG